MKIRKYQQEDESSWLRCRVLSFLDTAYYDIVIKKKGCLSTSQYRVSGYRQ